MNRNPFRSRKSTAKHGRRRSNPVEKPDTSPLPTAESARQLAFVAVDEFKRSRRFLMDIIDRHQVDLGDADRRLAIELATGVVRRSITLDQILTAFVARPKQQVEPRLWTLLQLGTYQLLFLDRVPDHAAVAETVELTKWLRKKEWTGFLNGVLRSLVRDIEAVELGDSTSNEEHGVAGESVDGGSASSEECEVSDSQDGHPNAAWHSKSSFSLGDGLFRAVARDVFSNPETQTERFLSEAYGFPLWLVKRWSKRFAPTTLIELCDRFNSHSRLSLRVNTLKSNRNEVLKQFEASTEIKASEFGPGDNPESIWYSGSLRPTALPGFAEGLLTVQDETAMRAARLLNPSPGARVLDLCAAPGTKTTHIAELMKDDGTIIAADSSARRLTQVGENAARLGIECIESLQVKPDCSNLTTDEFDFALVDVPCSNTGVLHKRAEVRSRLSIGEFAELAQIQLKILTHAARRVRTGGQLVYSTCSIEPEENSGVVNEFISTSPDWEFIEQHDYLPSKTADGGFQALLKRTS